MTEDLKSGDVITLGAHWSVPKELEGKFFRVESVNGEIKLSMPYEDVACTRRYHPTPPKLIAGRIVTE